MRRLRRGTHQADRNRRGPERQGRRDERRFHSEQRHQPCRHGGPNQAPNVLAGAGHDVARHQLFWGTRQGGQERGVGRPVQAGQDALERGQHEQGDGAAAEGCDERQDSDHGAASHVDRHQQAMAWHSVGEPCDERRQQARRQRSRQAGKADLDDAPDLVGIDE